MSDLNDELAFAREVVARAGRLALDIFREGFEVRIKDDRSPVTRADTEIEALIRAEVAAAFPRDAVLGEEEGRTGDGARVWVVDPIDGTRNFAGGIPLWGTLLALVDGQQPVLGVVEAPTLGERYDAVRGGGARLNGQPIAVSNRSTLGEATVCHPSLTEWRGAPGEAALHAILAAAGRSVGFGDFWGHCLVARGAADATAEAALRVWDWAAVKVIVEEAGGRMTTLDGHPCTDGGSVLTTNGRLHEELSRRFAR